MWLMSEPQCHSDIKKYNSCIGFPRWFSGKESTWGSIPDSGRSPGKGNCNPLQYSCLGIPMDRGGWWATGLEITKSWKQLSSQATSCITHCDKWNDGNHGGSQASELTCQRVGRLQSLSDDVWARTESVRAPSFQTGPDSRRLAL